MKQYAVIVHEALSHRRFARVYIMNQVLDPKKSQIPLQLFTLALLHKCKAPAPSFSLSVTNSLIMIQGAKCPIKFVDLLDASLAKRRGPWIR